MGPFTTALRSVRSPTRSTQFRQLRFAVGETGLPQPLASQRKEVRDVASRPVSLSYRHGGNMTH